MSGDAFQTFVRSCITKSEQTFYTHVYDSLTNLQGGLLPSKKVAEFFRVSHLSDQALAQIWEKCAPEKGLPFDKWHLFLGMKLIALAQSNLPLSDYHLMQDDIPLPTFDHPATHFPSTKEQGGSKATQFAPFPSGVALSALEISTHDAHKYDTLFFRYTHETKKETVERRQVEQVFHASHLSGADCDLIWDWVKLDEGDKVGREEFQMLLHLISMRRDGQALPIEQLSVWRMRRLHGNANLYSTQKVPREQHPSSHSEEADSLISELKTVLPPEIPSMNEQKTAEETFSRHRLETLRQTLSSLDQDLIKIQQRLTDTERQEQELEANIRTISQQRIS